MLLWQRAVKALSHTFENFRSELGIHRRLARDTLVLSIARNAKWQLIFDFQASCLAYLEGS